MSIFDGVVQLVNELNVHRALHVTIGKHVIYMILHALHIAVKD